MGVGYNEPSVVKLPGIMMAEGQPVKTSESYGEHYHEHLLEQYKLYVEMTDNIICLGWRDRSHYVFAIDPETGDIAWRITLKSSLLAPDPIMISDRIISLSEDSRTLLVYGVANGQQISQIPLPDRARLLVGYDDLLLVELGERYERMTRPGKISVVLP